MRISLPRVYRSDKCMLHVYKKYDLERRRRLSEIPGTDSEDNRVQFGSNPSTGELECPLKLTMRT
jgi:hypothetical protein